MQPPKAWVRADMESKELLTFCVKKVKGLNKVKLVDAGFLWTEPHSRRLKVKVSIQKEVLNGAILQQTFVVEVRHACGGGCAAASAARRTPSDTHSEQCTHSLCDACLACSQYVVEPHMCEQCQRSNTNSEVWIACVQVRTKQAGSRQRCLAPKGATPADFPPFGLSRSDRRWSTSARSCSWSS